MVVSVLVDGEEETVHCQVEEAQVAGWECFQMGTTTRCYVM